MLSFRPIANVLDFLNFSLLRIVGVIVRIFTSDPCLSFYFVLPKSRWACGFALRGNCGRQGTFWFHLRVQGFMVDMD